MTLQTENVMLNSGSFATAEAAADGGVGWGLMSGKPPLRGQGLREQSWAAMQNELLQGVGECEKYGPSFVV